MTRIRVLVGDDHIYAAEGLQKIISEARDMECLEVTTELLELPGLVKKYLPDVMVLDVAWLGDKMAGIHILPELRQIHPALKVVMITVYHELLEPARQAGAFSLSKGFSRHELLNMIRWAARQTGPSPSVPATIEFVPLTPAEQVVLEWIARGLSDKQIAKQLKRSEGTIKKHVSNTLRKLNASNRTEAAILAERYHLLGDHNHAQSDRAG
jgi:DNA-binding NarL/FixJ family response regulator